MVTPNLMKLALNQAGCDCQGECIHAKALDQLHAAIHQAVVFHAQNSIDLHKDPLKETFAYGLHVGYQLAHLESQVSHGQEN